MSYRNHLKQRIKELELEIANKEDHKEALEREMRELMIKDFEEEMREENMQKPSLLKG